MQLKIENEFQSRLMRQSFAAPTKIAVPADVQAWRTQWLGALGAWHSPYKVLVDATHLSVEDTPEVRQALELMLRFFKGFHLLKIAAFSAGENTGLTALPFAVCASEEAALGELGIRQAQKREPSDFRSTIQLSNHFPTHCIELAFTEPVVLQDKAQVAVLKSKMLNNLSQWHSKWSLLIDCANLHIDPAVDKDLELMFRALRGFFMKAVVGYSPASKDATYPFDVYRARHKAAAVLEGEGNFSGDKADCQSRRTTPNKEPGPA